MVYTPQIWIDESTSAPAGPVSAARLGHIETGLRNTASIAYNVIDYGATGNGTTDDTSSIQAAINAIPITGGVLFFPPGVYKLTSALTIKSYTILVGAGPNTSILNQTSTTAHGVVGVDLTHVGMRDLRITGPGAYTGSGSGVSFTLSGTGGNATFYVTISNVYEENFGTDGIAIATPIVSHFDRVRAFNNGRHGFNFSGDPVLQSDGTSCVITACFAAGNHAAGYHLFQMAYTALNGCAADANGIAYELTTCLGITANGCGQEEPYDFSSFNAGYTGLAWKISGTRSATLNSPYMIMNINISAWITGGSQVTINNLYEGSPGNPDSPVNNPVTSLQVDSGCNVILTSPVTTEPMLLAAGTTLILPNDVPASAVTTKTANYTAIATDSTVLGNAASGAITITLPTAVGLKRTYTVKKTDSSANTVTVATASSQTIDGATTKALSTQYASITIQSDGSNWWTISKV